MPTQLEEVVIDPDTLQAQDLSPQSRQHFLDGRARHPRTGHLATCRIRIGQRLPVDLPVRRARQRRQLHEHRRDQGIGQGPRQLRAQLTRPGDALALVGRDQVGDEATLRALAIGDHDRGRDSRKGGQCRLHLAGLDPEAAHLHLVIDTTQELQLPVRPPPHPIPTAIHPRTVTNETIRHEPIRRQVRTTAITTRHPHTGDMKLTHHPHRHRIQEPIQHVQTRMRQRTPDRHTTTRLQPSRSHTNRRLRRPIVIDHRTLSGLQRLVHQTRRGRFPTQDEHACGQQLRQLPAGRESGQMRRHDLQEVDRVCQQVGAQGRGVGRHFGVDQVQGPARAQRTEQHRVAEVRRRRLDHRVRAGAEADAIDHAVQIGREAAVRHLDALGPPRRARGVDDVRQAAGIERLGRGRPGRSRQRDGGGIVQRHQPDPAHRQVADRVDRAHHHRRPAVGQHERQPFHRKPGIQRQVGAAGLPDRQQRHHHVHAPGKAHTHDGLRAHAEVAQVPREPSRAFAQFPVRERRVGRHHGGDLGRRGGQRVRVHRAGDGTAGARPLPQRPRTVGTVQQRHLRQRQRRVGGQQLQHRHQATGEPFHGRPVEQLGAVLDGAGEVLVPFDEEERQVELRADPDRRAVRPCLEPALVRARRGIDLVVVEEHLEQRRAGPVAVGGERVDELLERHVLVGERVQRGRPGARHHVGQRRVARQIQPQHEGVDEAPDQAFELGAVAVGDRGPHDDVVLPGELPEHDRERRQQRHEHGGAGGAAERAQPRHGLRGDLELDRVAVGRADGRAGPVGGQFQRLGPHEGAPPMAQLGVEHGAAQPLPLPHREVGVLQRERRQR
ncbi:hypothetical protein GCM10009727_70180 [Actinomadura napierensis]|uniref:Uncharacterized protein n=1 Tax=Actinomadura napierensis TaxID=267854 RepID=A0ABP5M1I6_9ACTN